ncbi:hypothetical protein [uncultured Devosia sp.]|uniref:hypothetical protein n=1 Tax=uncultured Devosia sp. TaxID=211434 RepID=UPI0035C9C483
MIDIDKVLPLIVVTPPFPDESFQGFFARTLSKTAARSRNLGLALATVAPRPRTKRTFFSVVELANLATLLNVDVALLTTMSLPDVSRKRHPLKRVRSFYGTRIPFSMVDLNVRRISPTALGNSSFHRAMWTLKLFHLDGETLELLMSRCPVCNQQLGWQRSVHPAACDTCVDNAGRSNVDLRDYPSGPYEMEDPDAYRYVYSLINPITEGQYESPQDFSGVSRAVCFEAIFAMVRWMLQEPITRSTLSSPKEGIYQKIGPEVVASAGRYFLGGFRGLRDFETQFPGVSHIRSFGVIVSLNNYLGAGVKSLFEDVLRPSRARLAPIGLRSVDWLYARSAMPKAAIEFSRPRNERQVERHAKSRERR